MPVIPEEHVRLYAQIYAERQRQLEKWGEQHRKLGTGSKLNLSRADKARAKCDQAEKNSQSEDVNDKAPWSMILEEEFWEAMAEADITKLYEELVQVAAVAVAILEDIETNHAPHLGEGATFL